MRRISLVVQWNKNKTRYKVRSWLPVQGTCIWLPGPEESTLLRAAEPVCHNSCAHMPRAHAPLQERPPVRGQAQQRRVAPAPKTKESPQQQWRPRATINKLIFKNYGCQESLFFLLLSKYLLLYGYTVICLSLGLLKNILVISTMNTAALNICI